MSQVTEAVCAGVKVWQQWPLEEVYPIVYFDELSGEVRANGQVVKVAIYLAMGIKSDGHKEVLGMWAAASEGAKFWLHGLTELKNRGVFPHEESIFKLYDMALDRITKKWTMPIPNWSAALNRFAIEFGDRMPRPN